MPGAPGRRVVRRRPATRRRHLSRPPPRSSAERGFDAAGVDRIAARARVNKAMLYYHFGSKRALYLEVLRDMFRAVGARARAIADGPGTAAEKLDAWIATIVEEAAARPWFPPIMLRELASGAPRLRPRDVRADERRLRRRARHHRAGAARGRVPRRRSAADAPDDHAAHPDLLRAAARAGRAQDEHAGVAEPRQLDEFVRPHAARRATAGFEPEGADRDIHVHCLAR